MSNRDTKLIAVLFDELIPPRPELGLAGGGRPEVIEHLERRLERKADHAAVIDALLWVLDNESQQRHKVAFADLASVQRVEILRWLEASQELALPALLLYAYTGYYQQPDVLRALGLEARPPFPQGYEVTLDDSALLSKIRQRVGRPSASDT